MGHLDKTGWCKRIAETESHWYNDIKKYYPELLAEEYTRLQELISEGNIYGFYLKLSDLFELIIRWYVLTAISLAVSQDDTETAAFLVCPEMSHSFGNWAFDLPAYIKKRQKLSSSVPGLILKELSALYQKHKIVTWRNETKGHGALQSDKSSRFREELEDNLHVLRNCLEAGSQYAARVKFHDNNCEEVNCTIDEAQTFSLSPFITKTEDGYALFDSILHDNRDCKLLNFQTGERTKVKIPYLHGLREKYYGIVPISASDIIDEDVFTKEVEAALNHYHAADKYWKQQHYMDWLCDCITHHEKGIFLLCSDSGTGKSTFSAYIDGHGKAALAKRGITCRAYYFSRTSFRTATDFAAALCDSFRTVPENETDLTGNLPILKSTIEPGKSGTHLADFLNSYRLLHYKKFKREKLLLVLDGLDELSVESLGLLHFIPLPEDLKENIYILITCRSDADIGITQQEFISQNIFTQKKTFVKTDENEQILKRAIKESVFLKEKPLDEHQINQVAEILDSRFSGLPAIRAVLEHESDFTAAINTKSLIDTYAAFLGRYYGAVYYHRVEAVLVTLALAVEPLSPRQILDLATDSLPDIGFLAIMRDISPLLVSLRDIDGTKYILGHPDFNLPIRDKYSGLCNSLISNWQRHINENPSKVRMEYNRTTYIASGICYWLKDVQGYETVAMPVLEKLYTIAEAFRQSHASVNHVIRMVRIFTSVSNEATIHWYNNNNTDAAALALSSLAQCMPLYMQLEDKKRCLASDKNSQDIISKLAADDKKIDSIIIALFHSYSHRYSIMQQLGRFEEAEEYRHLAAALCDGHSDIIPNSLQIPFLRNNAMTLLYSDPGPAIKLCDILLGFDDSTPFQKADFLIVKGKALSKAGRQQEAGDLFRNAAALIEDEPPLAASDLSIYPYALYTLGQHLCCAENKYAEAIDVLVKTLDIYDRHFAAGYATDRFQASRILSMLGYAYRQLNADNDNKIKALYYTNQSLETYRFAAEKGIGFVPASADSAFINAAYTYRHYGMPDKAIEVIAELEDMQDPDDLHSQRLLERCRAEKEKLAGDRN